MLPIIILCAGEAQRMRPLTDNMPKCMIPVCGKPFIYWQIKNLEKHGFQNITITLGYKQEVAKEYLLNTNFGMKINVIYNNFLPNTGGGTKRASPLFESDFFVTYGDSYLPYLNYQDIQSRFYDSGKNALLTIYKNNNLYDKSNIHFSEEKNRILSYNKNGSNKKYKYIDYGLSVFSQNALSYVKNIDDFELSLLFKRLIKNDDICAYKAAQRFYEIGSFAGLDEFKQYISKENNLE